MRSDFDAETEEQNERGDSGGLMSLRTERGFTGFFGRARKQVIVTENP